MSKFGTTFMSEQTLVTKAVEDAMRWMRGLAVSADTLGSVEIVLAEALNNIVEHAYEYRVDGEIELRIDAQGDAVNIELRDHGYQFPGIPQKKVMKGNAIAFEELPEGGFGWFLIHSLTSSISYALIDGKNILYLEVAMAKSEEFA